MPISTQTSRLNSSLPGSIDLVLEEGHMETSEPQNPGSQGASIQAVAGEAKLDISQVVTPRSSNHLDMVILVTLGVRGAQKKLPASAKPLLSCSGNG